MGPMLLLVVVIVALVAGILWVRSSQAGREARAAFITRYRFPAALRAWLVQRYPSLDERQVDVVLGGLRQYFLACLDQRHHGIATQVGIPSKAVEAARAEFTRMPREYVAFCRRAFGGSLQQDSTRPREETEEDAQANTLHLVRSRQAPGAAIAAVPLLFAVDREIGLADGHGFDRHDIEALEARRQLLLNPPGGFDDGSGPSGGSGCDGGGDGGGGDS